MMFIRYMHFIYSLSCIFRLVNSLIGFRRVFLALVEHKKVSAKFCQVNELKFCKLKGVDQSLPCVDWYMSFYISCAHFI